MSSHIEMFQHIRELDRLYLDWQAAMDQWHTDGSEVSRKRADRIHEQYRTKVRGGERRFDLAPRQTREGQAS